MPPHIPWLHKLQTGQEYDDPFADQTFIFGTDSMGRDLWTRVWYGARVSLLIAFITIFIDMIIGMSYGLISGYFGGKTDMVMQRILEIANSIPRLVIVTLLLLVFKPGMLTIIIALMLTEWVGMSRIARAEMLKLKEQEGDNTIPFDTIQETVGLVFCMQDFETIKMLKQLASDYSQYFAYSDVAGIKQIQFTKDLDIKQVLDDYYGKDI